MLADEKVVRVEVLNDAIEEALGDAVECVHLDLAALM